MSLSKPGCQGNFYLQKYLFNPFTRLGSYEKKSKRMVLRHMKMFGKLEGGRGGEAELQAAVLLADFCC